MSAELVADGARERGANARSDAGARFDIVVPTIGRPSLARLLAALHEGEGPEPGHVHVVDDRTAADATAPLARREEIAEAPEVARDIGAAVDLLLGRRR